MVKSNLRSAFFPGAIPLFLVLTALLSSVSQAVAATGGSVTADFEFAPARQAAGHPVVGRLKVTIPDGWYIYADSIDVDIHPQGDYGTADMWEAKDAILPLPKEKYDEILETDVKYYSGGIEIEVPVYLADSAKPGNYTAEAVLNYQACSTAVCFPPAELTSTSTLTVLPPGRPAVDVQMPSSPPPIDPSAISTEGTATGTTSGFFSRKNVAGILLLSFIAGLGLCLTPCVYPMIPITIAVIGATKTESKIGALGRSLLYVGGISLTYAVLGVVAAASGYAFGTLLQTPAAYISLAILYAALAAAMYGLYSIDVPSSITSRLQMAVRGKGGLLGIFALGMVSGIAVTPCSAPVIFAAMGYVVNTGNLVIGFGVFTAIAWGMGLPLVVLGTFSGLLSSMPKSGEWHNTIKYIFTLGLLGAAFYFLAKSQVMPEMWYLMLLGSFLLLTSVFIGAFDQLTPQSNIRERIHKIIGLGLLIGALFVGYELMDTSPESGVEGINWTKTHHIEKGQIASEGRPAMLYFWQKRCPSCDELKEKTFTDPQIVELSEQFTTLSIDGTQSGDPQIREMLREYGVYGFPTIIFLDSDGNVVKDRTLIGFVPPEDLMENMLAIMANEEN